MPKICALFATTLLLVALTSFCGAVQAITCTPPVVSIANGGTGACTAPDARANLNAASAASNFDITSLNALSTPLPISEGGTGATTAADARSNLGLSMPFSLVMGGTGASAFTSGSIPFSNGSALTQDNAHFFWDNTAKSLSAPMRDLGGQVFNAKGVYSPCSSGAKGDGVTNDTAAVSCAISAAAATNPRSVVFFPPGNYVVDGGFTLTGLHGLRISGAGIGSTTLTIDHATNDLFYWTDAVSGDPDALHDFTFSDISVTASVVRTGGWVLHGYPSSQTANGFLGASRIFNIDVKNQMNGFWIAQYEFVHIQDIQMTTFSSTQSGGIAIKLGQTTTGDYNQGAELFLSRCSIYNIDASFAVGSLAYGLWLEDSEAVYTEGVSIGAVLQNDMRIVANLGGHSPQNHFFKGTIFDSTRDGHSVYLTGSGTITNIFFTGSWFASAGRLPGGSVDANGLRIDAATVGAIIISACYIYNTEGTGVYITTQHGVGMTFSNNIVNTCGLGNHAGNDDSLYINTGGLGMLGPAITGNVFVGVGTGGVSIRTSAVSNRILVVGNFLISGTSYGVAPTVSANNGS